MQAINEDEREKGKEQSKRKTTPGVSLSDTWGCRTLRFDKSQKMFFFFL